MIRLVAYPSSCFVFGEETTPSAAVTTSHQNANDRKLKPAIDTIRVPMDRIFFTEFHRLFLFSRSRTAARKCFFIAILLFSLPLPESAIVRQPDDETLPDFFRGLSNVYDLQFFQPFNVPQHIVPGCCFAAL